MRSTPSWCVLAIAFIAACAEPASSPATSGAPLSRAADVASVSTADELSAALSRPRAGEILVEPGLYGSRVPFVNNNGHRIRGSTDGPVVLTAGIVIGGSSASKNASIERISFDITDPKATLQGAAVNIWGQASGVGVFDISVDGHGVLSAALLARQPEGLTVRRLTGRGFTDYGIFVDASDQERVLGRPASIEDIEITGVARPLPRSSNGTAEACLWLGNTATVRRAVLSSCAWTGVWTGTANRQSLVEDVRIDDTPVAIYLEHFTSESVFRRIDIGPRVDVGFNCEWADPAWGGKPGCLDNLIVDSVISSCAIGVFLGSGTTSVTVRGVRFRQQRVGAVVDDGARGAVLDDNDYAGLGEGASPFITGFDLPSVQRASVCSRWSPGRVRSVN